VLAVVRRHPAMSATVVVQRDETAWSVWIAHLDGDIQMNVTQLDS
jgi:hypothetical protein